MKTTALAVLALLALTGCADSVVVTTTHAQVGFFHGLWHGMIAPFSFFVSLFDKDVAIYAVYNSGGWYDFGFMIGIGALFGGGGSSSNRK